MTVRVGMIGAGGIANYHFNHLRKMDDVHVVAVADPDQERARKMATEAGGAKVFADYQEMYEKAEMDAVFICIPPFAHKDQELMAVEKGIPFFVEKPPALTMELAQKVEAAVAQKGLITAVGFQDRYQDIMDELRSYLVGREVGLIHGSWIGGMPGVFWWRRKEMSGGQHVEQTIHIFDTARFLFGEVKAVSAAASTGLMKHVENYDVEDASAVTLYFENGMIGVIFSACYLSSGRAGKSGLDIYCRDARVEYRLRHSVTYVEDRTTREVLRRNDNGFACDRAFIEAVKTGDGSKVRSPYSDAVKSLAVPLAADLSLAQGGAVVPVPGR